MYLLNLCIYLLPFFTLNLTSGLPASLTNRRHVRAIGGEVAAPLQFPFVVSLNLVGSGHKCGGSIIHENWVVTSGQCMLGRSPTDYTILAGTNQLNAGGSVYTISKILIHPDFTNHTFYINDIAMVKIDGAFKFDAAIQLIPIKNYTLYEHLTVIGWGAVEGTAYDSALRYATVLSISDEDCNRMSEGGLAFYPRNNRQFCAAAFAGVGTCYGDYGGPLVNKYGYLVGIVSYSVSPCAHGYPDVYVSAGPYFKWINYVIEKF